MFEPKLERIDRLLIAFYLFGKLLNDFPNCLTAECPTFTIVGNASAVHHSATKNLTSSFIDETLVFASTLAGIYSSS
jgi:hypothetical protein